MCMRRINDLKLRGYQMFVISLLYHKFHQVDLLLPIYNINSMSYMSAFRVIRASLSLIDSQKILK